MSRDGIIWFNAKLGIATVSLASYGLVFSRATVAGMGAPSHVRLGFDAEAQQIFVAPTDAGILRDCVRLQRARWLREAEHP